MNGRRRLARSPMACSILARASPLGGKSRSPASSSVSAHTVLMSRSAQGPVAGEVSACRITRGASAAPRRYDELASYGMPMSVGRNGRDSGLTDQGSWLRAHGSGRPRSEFVQVGVELLDDF